MKAIITIIDDDGKIIKPQTLIEPARHDVNKIANLVYDEYEFVYHVAECRLNRGTKMEVSE